MKSDVLLVAETINNQISPVSEELCGLAARLLSNSGNQALFLIPGSDVSEQAEKFATRTGQAVCALHSPLFQYPNPELLSDAIVDLARESSCQYICFFHTSAGCQAAARTTVKTAGTCISGVNDLRVNNREIIFQRSLFNGKLAMETRPETRPVILTILPGAFNKKENKENFAALPEITIRRVADASAYKPVGMTAVVDDDATIDKADIIIAAGRGIGNEENLELVRRLARIFPNAAVAASRPLCDLKWLPYSRQVGATGKTVSPKLYLACGISGSQQHLYGMKDSQWIVAVNTDPHAAIFSVADFCIVEDVTVFLPLLADMYEKKRGKKENSDQSENLDGP